VRLADLNEMAHFMAHCIHLYAAYIGYIGLHYGSLVDDYAG